MQMKSEIPNLITLILERFNDEIFDIKMYAYLFKALNHIILAAEAIQRNINSSNTNSSNEKIFSLELIQSIFDIIEQQIEEKIDFGKL